MSAGIAALAYLACGVLFILALRGLSSPESAPRGNVFGMAGMALAVLTTLWVSGAGDGLTVGLIALAAGLGGAIGAVVALRIAMTAMPQLVAAFHSLVGLAAVLVAAAALNTPQAYGNRDGGEPRSGEPRRDVARFGDRRGDLLRLGGGLRQAAGPGLGAPGGVSGAAPAERARRSRSAWASRRGSAPPNRTPPSSSLTLLAFAIGVLIIIPIGGADMPVVVSMLNSYSGWAAAGIGFTLENTALIITGALVGASGAILSYIMCRGMNRSFVSVIPRRLRGRERSSGPPPLASSGRSSRAARRTPPSS